MSKKGGCSREAGGETKAVLKKWEALAEWEEDWK